MLSQVCSDPHLYVSAQESPVEVWVSSGPLQGWGHWVQQCIMGPFEGGRHYLHYLHHSLASGQIIGREHSPAHQQKIGLKIYWAWPHPSEQDPVSPSVSLSHQEASKSLLFFSIRGQTDCKPHHRKLTNLITWTAALSDSMKLWAMPCRATQDGRIMVESSDKTWSTSIFLPWEPHEQYEKAKR